MPYKMDISNHLDTGRIAETAALAHLEQQGLRLLRKNYHCYFGEIDLIMREGDYVVFIEVRHRREHTYGNALESVNLKKIKRIIKTATQFLQMKKWLYTVPCRFDIIAIHPVGGRMDIEWIKNAFTLDSQG